MIKQTYAYIIDSYSGLSKDIWLIAFIVLVNRMGTMVLPYLAIYLKTQIDLSILDIGIVLAPFGLGAVLGAITGGILTDKIGWKKVKIISLFGTAFFMIVLSFIHLIIEIKVCIFFMGYFVELFRPANAASVTLLSSEENRTKAYALNRLAINLGMSIGPFIGGFIAFTNYSYLFYIDAATCLIAAILILIIFKNSRINDTILMADSQRTSALNKKYFFLFVLAVSLNAIIFFQIFSTIPIFFKEGIGLNEKSIGTIFLINGLIIVLFEMILMNMFKNKDLYKGIVLGFLFVGFAYQFLNFESVIGALLFIVFLSIGEMLTMPLLSSYISKILNLKRLGLIMGIYVASYSAAHIVAPWLGTTIYQKFGTSTLWATLGFIGIINTLLISIFNSYKKKLILKT